MNSTTLENIQILPALPSVQDEDPEGIDNTPSLDQWSNYPLDDILVRQETRTVVDIVRRINSQRFIMDPDFQRDFIWSPDKQSLLIESALMRIPLPVFYLAETSDGRNIVVDGLQRFTTFQHYLANEFPLRNLEKQDLNGKRFSDLSAKHQNRLEDTSLILYLIDSKVPEQVKLDIFERVNGGVPLSRQQMRNCIHVGPATRWLKAEAKSQEFLLATGGSINTKQMRDREVINRFCGFKILGLAAYQGDMDKFLADTLNKMNTLTERELEALSADFRHSMLNNYHLFGEHAFRKHMGPDERRSVINVSLFDVFSTLLVTPSSEAIKDHEGAIQYGFYNLMQLEKIQAAITLGTNQVNRVRDRFALVQDMLTRALTND